MQSKPKLDDETRKRRKEVYLEVRDAFAEKYNFLGAQMARETLMSAASWNVDKYSDPPMRFRNHVMLAWAPGWLKSSMLRKMHKILGDDLVSVSGKLTGAVLRGSVSGGQFSPPKVLKTPIVISTEFGQTDFSDELLSAFLALLEEGRTNISLNKIAGMSEASKSNVKEKYGDSIEFGAENEFDLKTNFVFWGATHDPSKLTENALKSRFNIVTPDKPLTGEVTEAVDNSPPVEKLIDQQTVVDIRRMIKEDREVSTNFKPPSSFYKEYTLTPRESRDVQSYMASRNWWGLDVNPEIMESYIKQLKKSRRIASMSPDERVKNFIFDDPKSYKEIIDETGYTKVEIHNILERIDARKAGTDAKNTKWVVRSGEKEKEEKDDAKSDFLSDLE